MSEKTFDEVYLVNYSSYDDLSLYEVGCQKCPSSYSYGPIIRELNILHYILEGEGTLWLDGKAHTVKRNQIFVVPSHTPSFYEASEANPWNYVWIQFDGFKVKELLDRAGITKDTPVFSSTDVTAEIETCILEILHHYGEEFLCIGNVYRLFQYMISSSHLNSDTDHRSSSDSLQYIKNVIDYITQKYSEPIKINDIAKFCGLNRSYLTRLFKNATNYTPQEYLIQYRINKATQLLRTTAMPIQHISYSVGYNDPFAFTKLFKRETGLSPTEYRSSIKNPPITEHILHTVMGETPQS